MNKSKNKRRGGHTPGPKTKPYSIRHTEEIIEAAMENHPDLQRKGQKWLEEMAKKKTNDL